MVILNQAALKSYRTQEHMVFCKLWFYNLKQILNRAYFGQRNLNSLYLRNLSII